MVWMLFSVTASLTTHTLITRIVGVLPVTDCGQVEDPKMTKHIRPAKNLDCPKFREERPSARGACLHLVTFTPL